MKKSKKEIMLTLEIKICHTWIEREKVIYEKLLLYKKNLLNHLIIHVKELENACLNKYIVKYDKNLR